MGKKNKKTTRVQKKKQPDIFFNSNTLVITHTHTLLTFIGKYGFNIACLRPQYLQEITSSRAPWISNPLIWKQRPIRCHSYFLTPWNTQQKHPSSMYGCR